MQLLTTGTSCTTVAAKAAARCSTEQGVQVRVDGAGEAARAWQARCATAPEGAGTHDTGCSHRLYALRTANERQLCARKVEYNCTTPRVRALEVSVRRTQSYPGDRQTHHLTKRKSKHEGHKHKQSDMLDLELLLRTGVPMPCVHRTLTARKGASVATACLEHAERAWNRLGRAPKREASGVV